MNIVAVGKKGSTEEWIGDGIRIYEKRLSPVMNINTTILKTDSELEHFESKMKGPVFALDERGATMGSQEFSQKLFGAFEQGGANVSFIIGIYF